MDEEQQDMQAEEALESEAAEDQSSAEEQVDEGPSAEGREVAGEVTEELGESEEDIENA